MPLLKARPWNATHFADYLPPTRLRTIAHEHPNVETLPQSLQYTGQVQVVAPTFLTSIKKTIRTIWLLVFWRPYQAMEQ